MSRAALDRENRSDARDWKIRDPFLPVHLAGAGCAGRPIATVYGRVDRREDGDANGDISPASMVANHAIALLTVLRGCQNGMIQDQRRRSGPLTNSPRAARRIHKVCRSGRPQVPGSLANRSRRMPESSCRRDSSRRNTGWGSSRRGTGRHNSHMRCCDRATDYGTS
jgi:hypothetical protein